MVETVIEITDREFFPELSWLWTLNFGLFPVASVGVEIVLFASSVIDFSLSVELWYKKVFEGLAPKPDVYQQCNLINIFYFSCDENI